MSRSIKERPFVRVGLLKKIERVSQNGDKKVIKTWSRSSAISPQMIGHTIAVHDGRRHISAYATEDMVGHKLGKFVLTRTSKDHIKDGRTSKRK